MLFIDIRLKNSQMITLNLIKHVYILIWLIIFSIKTFTYNLRKIAAFFNSDDLIKAGIEMPIDSILAEYVHSLNISSILKTPMVLQPQM